MTVFSFIQKLYKEKDDANITVAKREIDRLTNENTAVKKELAQSEAERKIVEQANEDLQAKLNASEQCVSELQGIIEHLEKERNKVTKITKSKKSLYVKNLTKENKQLKAKIKVQKEI